jgi:hypothetical protein
MAFEALAKQQPQECTECQNFENHLQKLEGDVRQHIRVPTISYIVGAAAETLPRQSRGTQRIDETGESTVVEVSGNTEA